MNNHHQNAEEFRYPPKLPHALPLQSDLPPTLTPGNTDLSSVAMFLPLIDCRVSDHLACSLLRPASFISLHTMPLRHIQVAVCTSSWCSSVVEYSSGWMCDSLLHGALFRRALSQKSGWVRRAGDRSELLPMFPRHP